MIFVLTSNMSFFVPNRLARKFNHKKHKLFKTANYSNSVFIESIVLSPPMSKRALTLIKDQNGTVIWRQTIICKFVTLKIIIIIIKIIIINK